MGAGASRPVRGGLRLLMILCSVLVAHAEGDRVRVVFLEPVEGASEAPPAFRVIRDTERIATLEGWMENESARMALELYARAWALAPGAAESGPPVYHVALAPGGNRAAVGLRLLEGEGPDDAARELPNTPYIELGSSEWAFRGTFLHETGHVVLWMLNGGAPIPRRAIAAVPHTTAALTDRGTAFDEGFAIHLETLAAHFVSDPFLRRRYDHRRFRFGASDLLGEYHRLAGDLLSYAQSMTRYREVRENAFAFAPAYRGPDYLRVQLEKSRDFATLRDANQLLQSEGFQASFFFGLLVRGAEPPTLAEVGARQGRLLAAIAGMLASGPVSAEEPFLLRLVETYLRMFPDEAGEVIDVLLDLSHGVFVDRDAAALWREHYLGALRLDPAERDNQRIEAARKRWRERVAEDPAVLYERLGPQLRVEVRGCTVELPGFGYSAPLSFDLNTVEEGIIRAIPGISDAEVASWLAQRAERPFASAEDFRKRAGVRPETLAALVFE